MDEQLKRLQALLRADIKELENQIYLRQHDINQAVDDIRYLELKRKALLGQCIQMKEDKTD